MGENYTIYGLVDLREPEKVRYVGKTRKGLSERRRTHISAAQQAQRRGGRIRPVIQWILDMGAENLLIIFLSHQESKNEAWAAELAAIAEYTTAGQADLNVQGSQDGRWHGTAGGYSNHMCRCDACKEAWRLMMAAARARLRAQGIPDHVHGTTNGYGNYGCRCDLCKASNASGAKEYKIRRENAEGSLLHNIGKSNRYSQKIDESQAAEMRQKYSIGVPQEALAGEYNISDSAVSLIVRRLTHNS